MKQEQQVRVHRFGESVAFDSDSMSETLYLDKQIAGAFASAMLACCEDIRDNKFSDSQYVDRIIGHFEGR